MKLKTFAGLISQLPANHQAFWSRRKTWQEIIDAGGPFAAAIEKAFVKPTNTQVQISRADLRALAKQGSLNDYVVSTIIWGYPSGMRGNHVPNLALRLPAIVALLTQVRGQLITDWTAHFTLTNGIRGLGLSTYTKLLTFLPTRVEGLPAQILDEQIIKTLRLQVFSELKALSSISTYTAPRRYPEYLKVLSAEAANVGATPEQLEFFLYEYGLKLK